MRAISLYYLLIPTLLLGAVLSAPSQNRQTLNKAERVTGDKFDYTGKTRKGAKVYAVNRPSSAMLTAIDKGLADLFKVARKNGYSRRLKYSDYTIFIARPDQVRDGRGNYSPDIAVGAGQYAGSIYDQGGYIFAAGMVISFEPGVFVIAEHTRDFSRVSNVVSYEGEHIILYHNDRRRYNETADHSQGGFHPILQ